MGGLLALVGMVMLIVASFRVSVVWGLVSLLVPFGMLIFSVVHWSAAKRGFLIQLAAVPFFAGAVVLAVQQDNAILTQVLAGNFSMTAPPAPAAPAAATPAPVSEPTPPPAPPPLAPEIFQARWEANQRRFTELATKYTRLTARRTMLQTGNPEEVRKFNDEVALYVADLSTAQNEKRELEARRPVN